MTKDQWLAIRKAFPGQEKKPWTVLVWLADIALMGAAWTLWNADALLSNLAAWLVAGFALVQLYLIMHEATHNTVAASRFLNDVVGHGAAWFIGLPYLVRKQNHLAHHAWTAHPVHDPENRAMIAKFAVMTEKEAHRLERMWKYWIPMIAANHFLGHWLAPFRARAAGDRSIRNRKQLLFACVYLAGYATVFVIAWRHEALGTLAGFYLPVWVFLLAMVEMLNLPHHAEAPILAEDHEGLSLWEQDGVSHDCATVPLWSRFVILNFNLHIAHHLFPWLPWYRLPQASAALAAARTGSSPETLSEVVFSLRNRRRPLLSLMGHFFDRRERRGGQGIPILDAPRH
ncbi:fatty acid desaturase family protein [Paludibacterium paludis]|uniref:Fatty acid desaturase domain-containing protein n=1 Tax=Paludibacterium paludis TaxID=1225769 RepID=A0A918P0Z6_9NEIS|nr:fatty acid desaturase [Paludibacterium paludis]GGY10958.1 hypothetical protein GCM10011289_12240 [Paludibacterium paludis]